MTHGALAVIPARGGSKRIPHKNIKPFHGKPMIAWTIAAVLQSGVFDEVIVSTDCDEIAEVAEKEGASVPFVRPASLADDHTGLTAVVRHAIEWWRGHGRAPEIVACPYATAPFMRGSDLVKSVELLSQAPEADFVLAVSSFAAPVQRAIVQGRDGWLQFLWPDFAQLRSQDACAAYHDAGHFFMGRADAFMRCPTTMSGKTLPHMIPRLLCQDIDTPEDWEHAAEVFSYLQNKKGGTYL
jgi:pseudaminic acid cytidylyltransferase